MTVYDEQRGYVDFLVIWFIMFAYVLLFFTVAMQAFFRSVQQACKTIM